MRVLVLGGTGVAGRQTVTVLRRRGHQVRVLSRRVPDPSGQDGVDFVAGDLTTGAGLAEALADLDTVVDTSNFPSMRFSRSARLFEASMRRLGELGSSAGVRHLVVLSIVGIDRAPHGYYAAKVRHEQSALAGPIPATVLRATQFHDFPAQIIDQIRLGPVVVVPRMPTQPVATTEVAEALADAVEAGPATGYAPEVGGPRVEHLPDLVGMLIRRRGQRLRAVGVRLPGAWGRAISRGAALLSEGSVGRGPSYEKWLQDHPTGWSADASTG